MLYSPDNVPLDFEQAFLENRNGSFIHNAEGGRLAGYFIYEDINGNPTFMVRTDADGNIYTEGRKSLRYIVLFLLFSGLMVGASCKFLLDRDSSIPNCCH